MAESLAPIIGEELPLETTPKPLIGEEIPIQMAEPKKEPGMAEQIAKGLPMAGAAAGGMIAAASAPGTFGASLIGGPALVGAGAAIGKSVENIILSMVGAEDAPESVMEGAGEIIKEGALAAMFDRLGGKIIAGLSKKSKPAAVQALKAFEGIDERDAFRVLNDPDILLRGKPMEQAEKEFGEFIQNSGYKYGKDAVEEVTGVFRIGENQANKLINRTINRMKIVKGLEKMPENRELVKETVQEALAGRHELSNAIGREFARGGKEEARAMMTKLQQVDDWLETQIPGFKSVRAMYSEAKIKEAFRPFLPTNKNGTVSVLRTLSALGASVLNPAKGIPYLLASSPFVGGTVISGIARTKPVAQGIGGAVSEMAAKGTMAIMDKVGNPEPEEK